MQTANRFGLLFCVTLFASVSSSAQTSYQFLQEIAIGGEGGWDYLSVDATARRLYVTHATKVVVIDMEQEKVVGEIADTPGVHGFAVASELGLGFATNGLASDASVVDLKTLETLVRTPTGENPDAALYVPVTEEVYAFNGRSHSATVFEAKTGKTVTTVALPGKPEFAVFDPATGRVFNNIEDQNQVAVIDAQTHRLVESWPIAPGEAASGMAIDLEHHRLFIVCENELMVMMDSANGKVIASVPIGKGSDGAAYDPETHLAFSSNGEGTVTIVHQDSSEAMSVVQTLPTARSARTMTIDPKTHRIYVSAADFEPATGGERPKVIPETFRVLVYGPSD